jgi:TRAP-type mannitol/chloroaromatic compound transport system permease small subunit
VGLMKGYIRIVDGFNRRIGRIVMYGIFVMMGILLWSTFSKVGSDLGFDINPSLWTLEMAQFAMVAYYILGGPYSIQLGSNVRMDLIYGELSTTAKPGSIASAFSS